MTTATPERPKIIDTEPHAAAQSALHRSCEGAVHETMTKVYPIR